MLSSAVAAGNESQWLSDVRVSLKLVQWMALSVVTQANMSALSDKPGDVLQAVLLLQHAIAFFHPGNCYYTRHLEGKTKSSSAKTM